MPNNLLTINEITKEAVELFVNSNAFLAKLPVQWPEQFAAGDDLLPFIAPAAQKFAKVAFVATAAEKAAETRRGLFGWLGRAAAMLGVL